MTANEFFRKLMSGKFWANIGAMLIVVVLLCLGVKFGLDLYTHHGEEIVVPDVKHKVFSDAEQLLSNRGLDIQVVDTGYVKTLPPDCVLDQMLAPGSKVKRGRVVYVVINSAHSPMLTLPDIIDNNSYREARANLIAMGFKVGPPQYVSGEKDWVYGLTVKGKHVVAGDKVSVNDYITILVGNGQRDSTEVVDYIDAPESILNEDGFEEETSDVDEFQEVKAPEGE